MTVQSRVLLLFAAIFSVFAVLAKIDYAIHGYQGYFPPWDMVLYHWFWQWVVGVPLIGLTLSFSFYVGAPKTKRNLKISIGVFLTVIFLLIGQLEDFLYFVLNGIPFPEGEWTYG